MIWYLFLIISLFIAFFIIVGTTTRTRIWLVLAGIMFMVLGIYIMSTGLDYPNGNTFLGTLTGFFVPDVNGHSGEFLSNDGNTIFWTDVNGSSNNVSFGKKYFFDHSFDSNIAGYETLLGVPVSIAEVDENVTVSSATGLVLIDKYITPVGQPGQTKIHQGIWSFNSYVYVNSATGNNYFNFAVYKRDINGTDTKLFDVNTVEIDNTTVTEIVTNYTVSTDININITDRIAIYVSAGNTAVVNKIAHFVYQGTAHTSNVDTTLNVESTVYHNLLSNLNWSKAGHLFDTNLDLNNYTLIFNKTGATGLMKHTTTTGAISYVTDNSTNWNTAYGWGNHANYGYAYSYQIPTSTCRDIQSTSQEITDSTWTIVTFDTDVWDSDDEWNTSDYQFVPNQAGWYDVKARVQMVDLSQDQIGSMQAAGDGVLKIAFYVKDTLYSYGTFHPVIDTDGSGGDIHLKTESFVMHTDKVYLDPENGDTLNVRVYQQGAGSSWYTDERREDTWVTIHQYKIGTI